MGQEVGEGVEVIDVETWAEEAERVRLAIAVALAGGVESIAHRQSLAERRAARNRLEELRCREQRRRQRQRQRRLKASEGKFSWRIWSAEGWQQPERKDSKGDSYRTLPASKRRQRCQERRAQEERYGLEEIERDLLREEEKKPSTRANLSAP